VGGKRGGVSGGDTESDADEGPGMAECRYQICSWDETQSLLESNQELVLATLQGEKLQASGRSEQYRCRFCGQTRTAHECSVKRLGEQSISLCSETDLQRMAEAGEHIILASRAPGRARKLAVNDAHVGGTSPPCASS
jgi:hypothetical protein